MKKVKVELKLVVEISAEDENVSISKVVNKLWCDLPDDCGAQVEDISIKSQKIVERIYE